ncbi:MAG TPA: hypothetical protein VJ400_08810 [Thermoplasmata archaeon]|nr:hypothetical protein [Thermoplasmata archaeon]
MLKAYTGTSYRWVEGFLVEREGTGVHRANLLYELLYDWGAVVQGSTLPSLSREASIHTFFASIAYSDAGLPLSEKRVSGA